MNKANIKMEAYLSPAASPAYVSLNLLNEEPKEIPPISAGRMPSYSVYADLAHADSVTREGDQYLYQGVPILEEMDGKPAKQDVSKLTPREDYVVNGIYTACEHTDGLYMEVKSVQLADESNKFQENAVVVPPLVHGVSKTGEMFDVRNQAPSLGDLIFNADLRSKQQAAKQTEYKRAPEPSPFLGD